MERLRQVSSRRTSSDPTPFGSRGPERVRTRGASLLRLRCAYCGLNLGEFEGWLQLSVDHVIPQQMVALGYPAEWVLDEANVVACCARAIDLSRPPSDHRRSRRRVEEFFDVRDRVFAERRERILERRDVERRWFDAHVAPQASLRRMTAQAIYGAGTLYGPDYRDEPDLSGTGLPGRARRDALRRMDPDTEPTTGAGPPAPAPRSDGQADE